MHTQTDMSLHTCSSCYLSYLSSLISLFTVLSHTHTHTALHHSPRHWQDTWWTHPQWFIITHFRAMPLQRRKLNKQAMLSVTRWPSSSSRSCLSSTIDCTTDILELNGSRKKKLLTIAFAGHVKVLRRGGLQKGNKWFPEAASSFQKRNPSDTDAGMALWKGAVW